MNTEEMAKRLIDKYDQMAASFVSDLIEEIESIEYNRKLDLHQELSYWDCVLNTIIFNTPV